MCRLPRSATNGLRVRRSLIATVVTGVVGCSPGTPATSIAREPSGKTAASERPARKDVAVAPEIRKIVEAPDREPDDQALDDGRRPDQWLSFFGVRSGMRVAEVGAFGGYSAELLVRTVGPTGTVYGVNSPWLLEQFMQEPWTARLTKTVNRGIVRVDR